LITGKARFAGIRKIERILGYRVPAGAFHGATLEAVAGRMDLDRADPVLREQLLNFIDAFLRCRCPTHPLCGCPEREFVRMLVELRENGLDHRQIASHLFDEYGIDMYPADILSFLEDAVHLLEAIRDISTLTGKTALLSHTEEHIAQIER
jgi:superfamily II helicase